jgi:CheY-like chemotaxis protein
MPALILISDDNLIFRKALRQVLEGVDHWEIVEAEDGQEAIAKFQELHPNLVVLDLAMPVKDGLNAAREISKLAPEIPIVLYTMHNSAQLELEAQKSGIRKVLSKSDSGQLIATIQQLLSSTVPVGSTIADFVGTGLIGAGLLPAVVPTPEIVPIPEALSISTPAVVEVQPAETDVPTLVAVPKDVA